MFSIISTAQLRLGTPVVYHQEGRPENPLALLVGHVYDDPSLPEGDGRTCVLWLRPGGYSLEVRQEHLARTAGRSAVHLTTADCYACPPRSQSRATALTPGGWPACERHVAMYRREERADRWADNAVAALYSALALV